VRLECILDDLDELDAWNESFRDTIRVYVAMSQALLDGLVDEGEWEDVLGLRR